MLRHRAGRPCRRHPGTPGSSFRRTLSWGAPYNALGEGGGGGRGVGGWGLGGGGGGGRGGGGGWGGGVGVYTNNITQPKLAE